MLNVKSEGGVKKESKEKQASEPAFAHSSRLHMHNPGQRMCILLSSQKRGKN